MCLCVRVSVCLSAALSDKGPVPGLIHNVNSGRVECLSVPNRMYPSVPAPFLSLFCSFPLLSPFLSLFLSLVFCLCFPPGLFFSPPFIGNHGHQCTLAKTYSIIHVPCSLAEELADLTKKSTSVTREQNKPLSHARRGEARGPSETETLQVC